MKALVAAELLKLRTLRGPRLVAGVAMLLSGVIGFAVARIAADDGETVALSDLATAPLQAAWFAVVVLAVLASAGEFQHRSIRTTLLAAPQRTRVLLAKATTALAVGAAVVAATVLTALVSGSVTAAVSGVDVTGGTTDDVGHVLGGVVLGGLWALFATGLGMLTRSTAAALVAILLWRFVGETLVPLVTREPGSYAWTPSGAADALIGAGGEVLPVPGAVLLLALYVAAMCAAAGVTFVRRDPA